MHDAADLRPSTLLGHTDELRALAWCLARDDGADLVQDTWVAALQARTRPRSVGVWLRQVMRNEYRGALRTSRRRRARELAVPSDAVVAGPDDEAMHTELVLAMHEAVDALGEPYRAVVHARFFVGRSPAEIAIDRGTPPATVRWQLHEGLRRIREGLDARYGDRRHWHGGALAIGAWPRTRAAETTTMTQFHLPLALKWLAGLSIASGAVAVAVAQGSAPAAAQTPAHRDPAPPAERVFEAAPAAVLPQAAVFARAEDPASAEARDPDAPDDGACDGSCELPPGAAIQTVVPDDDALEAALAACEHLVPSGARSGRYEVEVLVEGGADHNTILGASVTRGRKLPCIDPDAGFDEPDGPDVVHFDPVSACVQEHLAADFVESLPAGERRAMVAVLRDPTLVARPPGPALPKPSSAIEKVDPAGAIAHFGLAGRGPADAKVSIVECGGYDCSFCNRARETIDELQARYGKALSLHFLQMPLDMHPTAELTSRAAVAAGLQGKFWEMHEALFDDKHVRTEAAIVEQARALGLDADRFARDLADPATAQAVADQRGVCMDAGARGTPSFFINGDLLVGSQAIDAFTDIIDDELAGR